MNFKDGNLGAKSKKRIFSVLTSVGLALALLFTCVACGDKAGETVQDGDLLFTLNEGGKSYSVSAAEAGEASGNVEIPESFKGKPVTAIGENAFGGCDALTAVKIPNSVTSIQWNAFANCEGLTTLEIPASVTSIGEDAFANCTALESVSFGKNSNLITIADEAFVRCSALTQIALPSGLTGIGKRSFQECTQLPGIALPNSVTALGEQAFLKCGNLQSITLSAGLKTIELETFSESGLKEITIPSGVTKICERAFARCNNLERVTFALSNRWQARGDTIKVNENLSWNANYLTSAYVNEVWTRI